MSGLFKDFTFGILVTSDRAASGERPDKTIPVLSGFVESRGGEIAQTRVVPDDEDAIQSALLEWVRDGLDVILTSGGTGLGPRDVTVDTASELFDKELPGFGEEMRRRSMEKTPFAILSRATAGGIGRAFVITLPGNPKGAAECLEFVERQLVHAVKILRGDTDHG